MAFRVNYRSVKLYVQLLSLILDYQTKVLDMCSTQYEKEREQDTSSSAQRPLVPRNTHMTDQACA